MNAIYKYYQEIKSGNCACGKWVSLAYEKIMEGLEQKKFRYSAKKAEAAIEFCENFVHHHEGALAPGLVKLELWQKAFLSCVFGLLDDDGRRHFREVFLVVGRKNGKTLLASAIAEYMMFLDGEYGARIYFAAPKLDQSKLCFDAFYQSILNEPELSEMIKKRRNDVYIPATNSSAKSLAFSENKSDGLNISCCIADELASWRGYKGLRFYEVIKSSFGSRKQPLLVGITTSGYENDGIFDELFTRSTRILMGDSEEHRLLPMIYTIDDIDLWDDINEIEKANPNIGVSITVDYILDELSVARGSLSKKAEFITKYCNLKQNISTAWLMSQDVDNCCGSPFSFADFSGCYCVGGLDLSRTTDLTSACIVIERDGILHVISKFWMPKNRLANAIEQENVPYNIYLNRGWLELSGDNFVDYHDCFNWFAKMIQELDIYPLMIGYDKYSAQYLVNDLNQFGFRTDWVYQGFNLTPVIREVEGAIKDGKINIGGNQLLKMHFLNSALKVDGEHDKLQLVKIAKNLHIDGMAAFLDAMTVRQKYSAEIGGQLMNK